MLEKESSIVDMRDSARVPCGCLAVCIFAIAVILFGLYIFHLYSTGQIGNFSDI